MKNVLFTCLFAFFAGTAAFAQATFHLEGNPATVVALPTIPDVETEVEIVNNTTDTLHIKWERIIIQGFNGLQTQVCDPVKCYFTTVSTKDFYMDPSDTDTIIVHFLNGPGVENTAIVHLKITDYDDPSNPQTAVYNYIGTVTGTHDPAVDAIKIFPNPTTETISVESDLIEIAAVCVFGMDGRQVSYFTANPGNSYNVADLTPGNYIVALVDAKGNFIKSQEITKR